MKRSTKNRIRRQYSIGTQIDAEFREECKLQNKPTSRGIDEAMAMWTKDERRTRELVESLNDAENKDILRSNTNK